MPSLDDRRAVVGADDQPVRLSVRFQRGPNRRDDLAVLSYERPVVLVELAFLSNDADRDKLTDPALGEFVEQSMPTVASAAKQQQATVYATVAAAAPQEVVDGDNVTVLVMLNRMVSTKDAPEAAASASRLSMKMTREGDTWKLSKLDAL